jgi:putative peptidoglycan binding protein
MKRKLISTVIGLSVALISLVGVPAYARGGAHGGGGGHAASSGGTSAGGVAHGYTGAGISHSTGSYGARPHSSGISPGRYNGYGQRYYAPRSSTGGRLYGSSARSQSTAAFRQEFAPSPSLSGSYYFPRGQSKTGFANRKSSVQPRDYSHTNRAARRDATQPGKNWSRQDLGSRHRLDRQTTQRLRNWKGRTPGYADAKHHHGEHWRDRDHHDHDWWHNHCDAIVLVGWGFWGWYDGWWYPAWGYDPYYSYYDYNGPIYGYDGLQPDEVIANVQAALQQMGYYPYPVDGVLGPATEAAIANYQRDYGLSVTGAMDPPTVRSLGLSI